MDSEPEDPLLSTDSHDPLAAIQYSQDPTCDGDCQNCVAIHSLGVAQATACQTPMVRHYRAPHHGDIRLN